MEKDGKEIEDDDLHFVHSLLPFIKKLPDLQRLRVKSKIQSVVQEEFEKLANATLVNRPNSPVSGNSIMHSPPGNSIAQEDASVLIT